MNDKNLMENILLLEKGVCDLFMHGTIESPTDNVHQAFSAALTDALCMQDTISVSYTHLDVYKRQIQNLLIRHLPVDLIHEFLVRVDIFAAFHFSQLRHIIKSFHMIYCSYVYYIHFYAFVNRYKIRSNHISLLHNSIPPSEAYTGHTDASPQNTKAPVTVLPSGNSQGGSGWFFYQKGDKQKSGLSAAKIGCLSLLHYLRYLIPSICFFSLNSHLSFF